MRRAVPSIFGLLFLACSSSTVTPPLVPATPVESAPRTLRYSFLMAGNRSGEQVTTVHADGSRDVAFEFNDRGRGPKIAARYEVKGTIPVSVSLRGNDYFKDTVDESFRIANGIASWKSTIEQGESAVAKPAFYLSMSGPGEEAAMLVRAALPSGAIALYPTGNATVRALTTHNLADGTPVTLYEVRGLALTPSYLWLDGNRELFASVSSWSSLIREGHESDVQKLLDLQDAISDRFFAETSRALKARAASATVITNARLFDPVTRTMRDGQTIVVRGNRIESVGAMREIPGAKVVDASGKTVIPGLWDMHTHVGDSDAFLNIAAGVTSIRDLANDTDALLKLKKRIESGEMIGPRIVMAGIIDGPGPFAGPTKMLVANEGEVRGAIDRYASLGYEQIKVYSSIKPELVPFIVKYAHEKGMRVSGHIPAYMRAEEAVKLGFDEIQHANMLFLNFYRDVEDTRTPSRFTAVAERGAELELDGAEVRDFVKLLRERNVVVDPTVSIFEGMFVARKGSVSPSYAAIADRLPPQVRRGVLTGGLPVPGGKDERYRAAFTKMLALIKLLHDSGVQIVAGTDDFAGFVLHRELENYVRAGIPAADVLRIATLDAARVAKREKDLGSVAPGKLADLVILDGDPLADISNVRKVWLVMKDGEVFDSRAIYRSLGVQ